MHELSAAAKKSLHIKKTQTSLCIQLDSVRFFIRMGNSLLTPDHIDSFIQLRPSRIAPAFANYRWMESVTTPMKPIRKLFACYSLISGL